MAAAGWVFLAATLVSLAVTVAHNHHGETDTYHVSVGKLFLLRCRIANATWSTGRRHNLSLPTGVEVRDGLLWFLPVQMSHEGFYTCEKRGETGSRMNFRVLVSSGECPDSSENRSISQKVNDGLPCKQKEIFRLNNTRNIRWMKDCHPVEWEGEPISVGYDGYMRLLAASEKDAGKYTCLVDFSIDGRKYTAARSIQLTIKDTVPVLPKPKVVFPQKEVVVVEVGKRAELKCLAYIGFTEDNEAFMYWTVNGTYPEDHKELNESWKYTHSGGRVYGLSTLSISKVPRRFLNVPIYCHIMTPAGEEVGLVWLQGADHSALYTSVSLCLVASLAIPALAAAFFFFKVDLVLAYRKLLRHFAKQQAPDGKLYDAYVSFLHPDTLSSAETASFALHILPEELENQHGYSLYIRGRDDCPGEAVHDTIAATVCKCRRLIIILSPVVKSSTDGKTEEAPLYDNQLCYEHKVGLYDALTQNSPRVILVEIDGPVDYGFLPESLRYIKRKQGALKWKKPSTESHKLTKLHSNRNFWKNLRYHMPSVPAGRLQTIV